MGIATSHSNLLSQTVQLPGISQAAPAGKWGVTRWGNANKKAVTFQGGGRLQEMAGPAQEKGPG